jgi:hypothetical protein
MYSYKNQTSQVLKTYEVCTYLYNNWRFLSLIDHRYFGN